MKGSIVKRAHVLEDLVPAPEYSALIFDWDGTVAEAQGKSADPDLIADLRNALFLNRVSDVGLVGHMRDLIDRNQGRRKMAVASGGDGHCLIATLNARNYRSAFNAIVTLDDVSAGKPSPEIFLKAASLLDVAPSECLIYEDSDEGIEAAHLANMDVIDVRPLRRATLGY